MRFRLTVILIILLAGALISCSVSPTPAVEMETAPAYQIQVRDVVVEPGIQIELMGSTTLPEGNCIYTQLLREGTAVDWWPVGKCFPVSPTEWTFSIPLGVEGAPQDLESDVDYCLRIWWPGAPSVSLAEYHFTLTEPSSP